VGGVVAFVLGFSLLGFILARSCEAVS